MKAPSPIFPGEDAFPQFPYPFQVVDGLGKGPELQRPAAKPDLPFHFRLLPLAPHRKLHHSRGIHLLQLFPDTLEEGEVHFSPEAEIPSCPPASRTGEGEAVVFAEQSKLRDRQNPVFPEDLDGISVLEGLGLGVDPDGLQLQAGVDGTQILEIPFGEELPHGEEGEPFQSAPHGPREPEKPFPGQFGGEVFQGEGDFKGPVAGGLNEKMVAVLPVRQLPVESEGSLVEFEAPLGAPDTPALVGHRVRLVLSLDHRIPDSAGDPSFDDARHVRRRRGEKISQVELMACELSPYGASFIDFAAEGEKGRA
jgi:hypothetical protein